MIPRPRPAPRGSGARRRTAAALAALALLSACARRNEPTAPPTPPDDRLIETILALQRENRFAESRAACEDLLARYPESLHAAAALFWLGFNRAALGNDRAALAALGKLVARFPHGPFADAALLKAYGIHARGAAPEDRANARRDLETLLARFPDSPFAPEARLGLARLAEEEGRVDEALALYDDLAARAAPGDPSQAGIVRWRTRLAEMARSAPAATARYLRGRARLRRGLTREALADLLPDAADPVSGPLWEERAYDLAVCRMRFAEWPEALRLFQTLAEEAADGSLRAAAARAARRLRKALESV